MKGNNEVAVIPSRFTGGQPVVISRSSIRELFGGRGGEVRVIMSDNQEINLKVGSQVTKAEMDELYGILFGSNVLRFKALAQELGSWRKLIHRLCALSNFWNLNRSRRREILEALATGDGIVC